MVHVTNTSMLSGITHTLDINVDPKKLQDYNSGAINELIQNVFPELTPYEREFIMTGITQEEWDSLFAGEQ